MKTMEFVLSLMPMWILACFVIYATFKSGNKDLLRFELKPALKWLFFIFLMTILRCTIQHISKSAMPQNVVTELPIWICGTVFWEDVCHAMAVVLLMRLIPNKILSVAAGILGTMVMAVAFGLGHLYQGYLAAAVLGTVVFFSFRAGKKYGFGTVIFCHIIYDFMTLLFIKYIAGML